MNTIKSWELFERAYKVMPGGASSHGHCYPVLDPYPISFDHGKGSHFWDVDGNEYYDFMCAFGPLILGHAHPAILNAIRDVMDKGLTYATLYEDEVRVSEKLCQLVPNCDMVRYGCQGTESTLAAIRIARGYTGRDKIIKFEGNFHGVQDYTYLGIGGSPGNFGGPPQNPFKIPASWGIPASALETVILQPWNDIDILEKTIKHHADEIACVITEPVLYNIGAVAPEDGYLKGMQELCNENDIVLILDEMITGFRLALGGAQEYFGIDGDLMCFGKALAGGMPLSAVCGKREIMEVVQPGKVAHMGTFNIHPLSAAASLATLGILSENDGQIFTHLTKMGNGCRKALETATARTHTNAIVQGVGGGGSQIYFTKEKKITNYREFFTCDMSVYPKFHKECMKRGVYFHPWQVEHLFICTAHTEDDIAKLESVATEALRALAS